MRSSSTVTCTELPAKIFHYLSTYVAETIDILWETPSAPLCRLPL